MKIKLGKTEQIHFVGIGGIGMSGLALIMKELGFKVQGSDISLNKNIERLKKKLKFLLDIKNKSKQNNNFSKIFCNKKNNSEILLKLKEKIINLFKRRYVGSCCFINEKYSCCRFTWKNNNYIFNF